MHTNSQKLTAFVAEGKGLYEYLRMPFGLTGAPSTFQKLMDELRGKVIDRIRREARPSSWTEQIFAYLDDWIIVSRTFEEHLQMLQLVFDELYDAHMIINLEKSHFAKPRVEFLGFLVDSVGLRPNPDRIKSILEFPKPRNRRN